MIRISDRSAAGVLLVALIAIVILLADRIERSDPGGNEVGAGSGERARAEVLRVIDGDTIEVDLDGVAEDVRYIGIDTPETVKPGEPVQCFGKQASAHNDELVGGATVRLRFDRELRDRFGRLLAYVYVGETFVNGELVAGGYARTLAIEPNTAMAETLARLQVEASTAGRGLWSSC